MRAGALRHRITLLKITESKVFGEITRSTTESDIRCYRHNISGSKRVDNSEVFTDNTLTITIRNQHDLTNKDRFRYAGEEYQINLIVPSYDGLWLRVTIKKVNT